MTLFLVVIFQILLILIGIVIVSMSYEIPKSVVIPQQQPLDNPPNIGDNNSIEIEKEN
jgi:hypothetical protein